MRAIFLDYDSVDHADLDPAALLAVLPDLEFQTTPQDQEVMDRIRGAEFILGNKMRLDRTRLAAAARLRLIALAATGTDNIDLAAARELGVGVCNVVGYCTPSVVQHAWSLILSLTQNPTAYHRVSVGGSWQSGLKGRLDVHPLRELAGRTLGIVGWGELGRGVARLGEAFGMRVVIANRPGGASQPGRLDLDELLRTADIVSLHCPVNAQTRGLIGTAELALMKPGALLINTARGGLVDSAALAAALRSGRLGGAGIDVLAEEPPVNGDPLLDPALPNLIVTPHVAWAAREARQRCIDEMAANIRAFLAGERRMRVD